MGLAESPDGRLTLMHEGIKRVLEHQILPVK
jgi:hypothetical protein